MSAMARLGAEHTRRLEAGVRDARVRGWPRPPAWLWGVSVVVQVISAAALTSFTFFFLDDFVFLSQARTQSFDVTYLRGPLYEHFSPISRLLDRLLVELAPGSFALAHGFELALYASVLGAFALVVRTILGNGWSAFAFTVIFGQSIFLMRLLFWWTATANILPASIFMLLALWCYLRWREIGSRKLLGGSLFAFACALLDYETAILFPAYVAIISLLVLERRPSWRASLASLYRERWAWTGFAVLDAAALLNYYAFYYSPSVQPPLPAVAHYLEIALWGTFVPALVGIRYSEAPVAIATAGIVVGSAVAMTLYLRPRAWRCLAAFILVFLLTMLPLGLNRIAQFGVSVGHILYYQQSLQFMFLVLAAFAISPGVSGRRASPASGTLRAWLAGRRRIAIRQPSRRALAAAGAAAVAGYGALYLTSLGASAHEVWQARQDRAYVSAYLASLKGVRAATGREPVLIDLMVPRRILPKGLHRYTTYGEFFALFNPTLRVDEIASPAYVLNPHGQLAPVSFAASTRGLVAQARVSATVGSGGVAAAFPSRSVACVPAGRSTSWLRVPLARAQRLNTQTNGLPDALRVHFRMPASAPVAVTLLARAGGGGFATVTHVWDRGSGGQLIPLAVSGEVREFALELPPRACITGFALGRLRFIHGS